MGNSCFGRGRHRLLKEETERSTKLEKAMLVLAEIAETQHQRKQHLDKQMIANRRSVEELLQEYARRVRTKEDVKQRMFALETDYRYQLSCMAKVNAQLLNTRQHQDVVREFSLSIATSQKMATVVDDLGSIGFKITNLDKTADKVEDVFGRMREVNGAAIDTVEESNEIDLNVMYSDFEDSINKQLEAVDDHNLLQHLNSVPIGNVRGARPPSPSRLRSPHSIGDKPLLLSESKDSDAAEEEAEAREERMLAENNPFQDLN